MDGAENGHAADAVRQRCKALIKARDLDGALAAGRELTELAPRDYQAWRLYAKAASLQPGSQTELAVLDTWLTAFPNRPGPALRMAKAYLAADDTENAEAAFQTACASGLSEQRQTQYQLDQYWRARDWRRLATLAPAIEAWDGPPGAAPWVRIAIARFLNNDQVGGLQAVDNYLSPNPGRHEFIPILVRSLIAADRPAGIAALIARLRRNGITEDEIAPLAATLRFLYPAYTNAATLAAHQPAPTMKALGSDVAAWLDDTLRLKFEVDDPSSVDIDTDGLAAALQASLDGQYDVAVSRFDASLEQDWPPNARARITEMRTMLDRLATTGTPGRAIIDPAVEDIVVSESLGTGRLAVIFTGIGNKVSGMPLTFFDRILAANGYQAIYLRDMSRCLFAAGIRSMGSTAQATLAELRKLVDGLEHSHLITLGVSAGGYAGLRYGLELEADRVFAFSPLTVIETEVRKQLGDERLPALGHAIQRRVTDEDFFSPVWDVMARRPYPSQVDIFATEGSAPDTGHARKMIGSPNVTVHMIGGSNRHDCLMTALTHHPDLLEP